MYSLECCITPAGVTEIKQSIEGRKFNLFQFFNQEDKKTTFLNLDPLTISYQ